VDQDFDKEMEHGPWILIFMWPCILNHEGE
jgi:hypothetical protein